MIRKEIMKYIYNFFFILNTLFFQRIVIQGFRGINSKQLAIHCLVIGLQLCYIEASCVFRVGGEVEQEAAKLYPQMEVA